MKQIWATDFHAHTLRSNTKTRFVFKWKTTPPLSATHTHVAKSFDGKRKRVSKLLIQLAGGLRAHAAQYVLCTKSKKSFSILFSSSFRQKKVNGWMNFCKDGQNICEFCFSRLDDVIYQNTRRPSVRPYAFLLCFYLLRCYLWTQ